MAKQSSVNLDITNNADGFDISGGTTARKLGITGGDVTIAGSGSATVTFPTTSTTIAGLGITQSFSTLQSFSAGISAAGGVTLGSRVDITGILDVVGGVTLESTLDVAGVSRFAGGVTLAGTFSGTTGSFSKLLTLSNGLSAAGGVTFTSDIRVNTMTIGRGNGQSPGFDSSYNTAVGFEVLKVVSPDEDFGQGIYNTGLGYRPLRSLYQGSHNTALGANSLYYTYNGTYNTAVGSHSLSQNTSGGFNTAIGAYSIGANVSGIQNVGIGYQVLQGITQSNYNTAVGYLAGLYRGSGFSTLTSATGGIFIGHYARGSTNGQTNEIVIGRDALGLGSNTTVLGATTAVSATIYGLVNAPSGISASGATFSGNVNTDYIFDAGDGTLRLNDKANTRVAIGDFSGNANYTYIYLRDNMSFLDISNPYGSVVIGDPSGIEGGYSIAYNSAAGSLDGGNSALTNFYTGSFNGLLTASAGISAAAFNGATGSFSKLLTTSAGISAGGTTAATFNGLVDMSFNTLFEPTLRYYNEPVSNPTITGNALTVDLSAAQVFGVTLNSPINTFTISNTPATANRSIGFTLILTADGTSRGVTWGSSVKWSGGVSPTMTSTNGKKDIFTFMTVNGGTEWLGFIAGQNF